MKSEDHHIATIVTLTGGCNMEKNNERRSFLKYLLSLSAFIAGSTISSDHTGRFAAAESGSAQIKKKARLKNGPTFFDNGQECSYLDS